MNDTFSSPRQIARETGDFGALIAAVPYAAFLGVQLSLHQGKPRACLPFRADLVGSPRLPAMHGGVTAAFMENAAMLHLLYQINTERVPKSIDFSIDYLLPARTEELFADCEVGRIGSRVAQTTIRCWQKSQDRPVAIARAHFLLTAAE
ncbi:MAG TPA: PaaI family thioesterase [Solimonas sp.]|nr:PaaI family thioesterase [Solimonas sp.]